MSRGKSAVVPSWKWVIAMGILGNASDNYDRKSTMLLSHCGTLARLLLKLRWRHYHSIMFSPRDVFKESCLCGWCTHFFVRPSRRKRDDFRIPPATVEGIFRSSKAKRELLIRRGENENEAFRRHRAQKRNECVTLFNQFRNDYPD